jgi:integrase
VVFFRGVLDWATTRLGPQRKPILPFNPIARVKRVRSTNPRTPVATWNDFLRVYRYSDRVDSQRLLRSLLMLAHEHGWRLSAWCQLRASDVDRKPGRYWPHGRIRKRAATDKKGKEQWVPLTPRARKAVDRLIRRSGVIGDAYLFPAPRATGAWRADHALDLLHRTEQLTAREYQGEKHPAVELGGFHALRRKWASDRKDQPLVDVANAGDWHPATLYSHYQKADPATTLRVVLGGAKG